MKPIFFGNTRVDDEPVNSITLVAPTTTAVYFNILPQKMQFQFDDLLSNDNTPLDVNMYMIIQVKKGQTPDLLRNYGENWFENFIEPYFRNKVREYVSSCSPFDLMSNREVLAKFDDRIKQSMRNYVAALSRKANFPIDIQQVITDRVMPNKEQLEEMNKTAASIQAKQTQEKRAEMELARAKAERNKAVADKAYMTELNLSPHSSSSCGHGMSSRRRTAPTSTCSSEAARRRCGISADDIRRMPLPHGRRIRIRNWHPSSVL